MVLYPDVQQKAQEELDAVVGSERLPTWEDRENLPYIRAIVEESLRCEVELRFPIILLTFIGMPTTLTAAVPHSVSRDDEYEGYHIPKGAMIMMNVCLSIPSIRNKYSYLLGMVTQQQREVFAKPARLRPISPQCRVHTNREQFY